MPWTNEDKVKYLMRLPWTLVPDECEGDRLLRVREIPAAVGTSETDEQLVDDLWESLQAALHAYVEFGDAIPLPPGVRVLPWNVQPPAAQESQPVQVNVRTFTQHELARTAQQPAVPASERELVAA